jgi:hypothetical protein
LISGSNLKTARVTPVPHMTWRGTRYAAPHTPEAQAQTHLGASLKTRGAQGPTSWPNRAVDDPKAAASNVREPRPTALCRQTPIFIHKCPSEPRALSTRGGRFGLDDGRFVATRPTRPDLLQKSI